MRLIERLPGARAAGVGEQPLLPDRRARRHAVPGRAPRPPTTTLAGRAWDAIGPELMTHGHMMERIAEPDDGRPPARATCSFSLTAVAAPVAAAVAGEDVGLIEPADGIT